MKKNFNYDKLEQVKDLGKVASELFGLDIDSKNIYIKKLTKSISHQMCYSMLLMWLCLGQEKKQILYYKKKKHSYISRKFQKNLVVK